MLLSTAWGLQCKSFTCKDLPNSECVSVGDSAVTFSPCPVGLSCPEVSMFLIANQTCALPELKQPVTECFASAKLGQNCGANSGCTSGLHCSTEGVCVQSKKQGESCSKLDECLEGLICNSKACVPYFSVKSGEPADSKVACKSAIISQGICQPPSESVSMLPVKCSSDEDCLGSDGVNSSCYCAGLGLGFCSLHSSDLPVKEYLASVHNGEKEKSAALLLKVVHYAQLQSEDTCLKEHLLEFKELERRLEWSERCAALAYSFISVLALVTLL